MNEKVTIAHNGHLQELADRLSARHNHTFQLFSFILLRDSSALGSWNGLQPSPKDREINQSMREKNVLRLDWSETNENDDRVDRRPDKQSYLDMIFKSIGLEF